MYTAKQNITKLSFNSLINFFTSNTFKVIWSKESLTCFGSERENSMIQFYFLILTKKIIPIFGLQWAKNANKNIQLYTSNTMWK